MTPAGLRSLRNGAINAALWGGVVAFASGGSPAGVLIAAIVALVAGLWTTGLRLPATLFADAGKMVWGGAKGATGLWSASVPVKRVVPLLLVTAFAGRGCDLSEIHIPISDIDWHLPDIVSPLTPEPEKATAATYVYEQREGSVPAPVLAALSQLNGEKHILATTLDVDVKDGTGDEPEQYKVVLAAARKAGLPALVITSGDKVLAVVANPKTEQVVLEAVK